MKFEYIQPEDFKAITKAAHKGNWTERAITALDKDLNKTKCLHGGGGYIVVDDAYAVTVLHVDERGFVSTVMEID